MPESLVGNVLGSLGSCPKQLASIIQNDVLNLDLHIFLPSMSESWGYNSNSYNSSKCLVRQRGYMSSPVAVRTACDGAGG